MNAIKNNELSFRIEGHLARITLNRPDVYNALSDEMRDGLRQSVEILRKNTDIRIVILTGAGKAFCAGGDIKLMKQRIDDETSYRTRLETYRRDVADVVKDLCSIRQPVIALINGHAFGAGATLAMLCDIRISSENAKFGLPFGKRGLIPDWGATYFLPRIVGRSKAIGLMATGRSFDAKKALQIGFVDEVVAHEELEDFVKAYCQDILESSPFSIMAAKAAIYQSLESGLDAALEIESKVQSECYLTDDHREGVECFLEKRPPKFTGS